MSRSLWFVAGASAGVYAASRVRRLADSVSAEGMRARWQGLTHGARLLGQDVKQAQADREAELRESFGLAAVDSTPQLSAPPAPPAPTLVPPIDDRKNDH